MERTIEERLRKIVGKELRREPNEIDRLTRINDDSAFHGWMLTAVESEFNIKISLPDRLRLRTLGDLVNYVIEQEADEGGDPTAGRDDGDVDGGPRAV